MTELRTERLIMRRWRDEDRAPFAAMTADPEVQRYFPAPLTRAEADAFIDQMEAEFDERGWSLWALEVQETGAFIGYTGLEIPGFEEHFTPAVEVGWRLAREAWGHGYATEAAQAALDWLWRSVDTDEILSLIPDDNPASARVAARLGFTTAETREIKGTPVTVHRLRRP